MSQIPDQQFRRRNFNIKEKSVERAGYAIMEIPHLGILGHYSPNSLMEKFYNEWGLKPRAIVLPVTYSDGLLFDIEGLKGLRSPNARISDEFGEFKDVVYTFAEKGLDIYLLIDPTLQFLRTDSLHIVDIVGDSSSSVCIGNPSSREIIAAILGTAIDETLDAISRVPDKSKRGNLRGVVLDIVNIWPMGAVNERLELTCFCPSCQKYFNDDDPTLVPKFRDFPNPWNLLLKDSGGGISFIDEVKSTTTPNELIGLSRQKAFHTIFDDRNVNLVGYAELLKDYIKIRHEQTLFAVNDIFELALKGLDERPQRILLLEGVYYGWTSGIQLDRLDRVSTKNTVNAYDEIWFDPSSTELYLSNVPFSSFMWKRSHYYLDAFFQFVAGASDARKRAVTGLSRLSKAQVYELIGVRLNQALGTAMTGQASLFALPELRKGKKEDDIKDITSQRMGFIGVVLDQEIGKVLIPTISAISPGTRENESEE